MKSKDNTTNFLNKIIIYPYLKTQNHELSTNLKKKKEQTSLHKLTINPFKNFETPNFIETLKFVDKILNFLNPITIHIIPTDQSSQQPKGMTIYS